MPLPAARTRPSAPWRLPRAAGASSDRGVIAMACFIAALHLVGWLTLVAFAAPGHPGAGVFGIGVGLTAYVLGMRHAFDADHIAAIDNTTRKLMSEGRRPLSVGFWFSLGHSSIVFGLAFLLAIGIRSLAAPVNDADSQLHDITGLIGTLVSSGFLYVIAILNVIVLVDIWKTFRRIHAHGCDDELLEHKLAPRGMVSRLLRPAMRFISEPWQMYFVGLLFGLGFDTATEIALLVLTGSGAASGFPWYALLCLPVLFAAGMSLLDTIDGCLMYFAYGWAMNRPARKLYYNMVITGLSVIVAVLIGSLEILNLVADKMSLEGRFWSWAGAIDLNDLGMLVVGLLLATWIVGVAVWKLTRADGKWTATGELPPS